MQLLVLSVLLASGTAAPVNATGDCCLGDPHFCCSGVEYCCNTCNGGCTCSQHGKCHDGVEGATHPTLPTMWTAMVKEAQVGVVKESYLFVDKPTDENPSAKWTNFTDGSCNRLIYKGRVESSGRFLLGCDAVDCCTEEQTGNHLEYQIPNIHPAFLAPVKNIGKKTITLFDKTSVDADVWSWKFGIANYSVYTNGSNLARWAVSAAGNTFVNDYAKFTVPTDVDAFKATFQVPKVCLGNQVPKCGNAVSAASLAFLRAGDLSHPIF